MLETLAEQPVRFDQEGLGRGHGGLSPKGLMIERRCAPRRYGAARSRLRWRDTARKIAPNKDKINTLSWINGSMRAGRPAKTTSAFRLRSCTQIKCVADQRLGFGGGGAPGWR